MSLQRIHSFNCVFSKATRVQKISLKTLRKVYDNFKIKMQDIFFPNFEFGLIILLLLHVFSISGSYSVILHKIKSFSV